MSSTNPSTEPPGKQNNNPIVPSLIASASFASTESDPSDANLPPSESRLHARAQRSKATTPVQHIPTQEAYDQWADVYDSDGNMLQSVDDLELETLLPNTINEAYRTWLGSGTTCKFSMIDLGCGTGRNTAKLLALWSAFQNKSTEIDVTALDFSRGMLDVARQKLKAGENIKLHLEQADCFPTVANEAASPVPHVEGLTPAWLVISTLVLEHIPLKDYFKTLAALVNKGGYALVTNMHSDMGRISQAGFVNAQGVKVRGTSFAFTPEETVEAAQEAGFKVLSIKETEMETSMIQSGRVGERGNKWLGIKVWYGLVLVKE